MKEKTFDLTKRYQKKLYVGYEISEDIHPSGILLQLEVTNACNHRCIFCPNHVSTRKVTMMDYSFAKRIIDECDSFLGDDRSICFHMNGEPLLYPQLPELVSYAKKRNFGYCFLTTNGSQASVKLLKEIFDNGLDSIKFSINAGSPETYKKIHGTDDYDKVMDALRFSYDYRNKSGKNYKIFVSCVGVKDNQQELRAFNKEISKYCDEVVFYYPCSYAGWDAETANKMRCDLSEFNAFEIKHTIPCAVLWNSINVTCEGYLSLCCSESDNRLIVEDLNNIDVKSAWMSNKMNKIRLKHKNGDVNDLPCYSCVTGKAYIEENMNRDLMELAFKRKKR